VLKAGHLFEQLRPFTDRPSLALAGATA
jgi:aspartyl-tRNA(Asn)/glutamyl-tRNA(Gln) amidotransferase subunit A